MSVLISQFILFSLTRPPCPHIHISIIYICVSLPVLQIVSSVFFFRLHIYVLIYCIYFSMGLFLPEAGLNHCGVFLSCLGGLSFGFFEAKISSLI